jgi:hypothetical protein
VAVQRLADAPILTVAGDAAGAAKAMNDHILRCWPQRRPARPVPAPGDGPSAAE